MRKWLLLFVCAIWIVPIQSHAYTFNLNLPFEASNITGLAVNPANGHVHLTTLSYIGGIDNLWEYDTNGTLINSTRVPISDVNNIGGHIGPIDFMNDGRIISGVSVYNSSTANRYAYTYDADGSNPTLQFEGIPLAGALSYASLETLFTITGFGDHQFGVNELTVDGTLLSTLSIRYNRSPDGLAYDSVSENMYVAYISEDLFMEEYVKDANGDYQFSQAYDLSNVIGRFVQAMDYENGLFYAAYNNEAVSVFGLDDLTMIDPPDLYEWPEPSDVPIPGAALLLGSGLLGLAGVRRKIRG